MMYTIAEGDEYDHSEYGLVTVQRLEEELDEGYITETDDGLVFDGASVVETRVVFRVQSEERVESEEVLVFCENVQLE